MILSELTQEIVGSFLNYNVITGELTWKNPPSPRVAADTPAGSLCSGGYRRVKLLGKVYPATHLIWLMVYGTWPTALLDHRNGDISDNSLKNLREATSRQNAHNRAKRSDNRSGFKGVRKRGGRWQARIWEGTRNISLGVFDDPHCAAAAYDEAALRLQGPYAKTNKALGLRG